jgi:hypothetical protein
MIACWIVMRDNFASRNDKRFVNVTRRGPGHLAHTCLLTRPRTLLFNIELKHAVTNINAELTLVYHVEKNDFSFNKRISVDDDIYLGLTFCMKTLSSLLMQIFVTNLC